MNKTYTSPRIVSSCSATQAIMSVAIPKNKHLADNDETGTTPAYEADE